MCAYKQIHMGGHDSTANISKPHCVVISFRSFLNRIDRANQNLFAITQHPNQVVVDYMRTMWALVGFVWHRTILAKEGGFLHPLKRSGFRRQEL
ncbi:MAG TPA: hypothetical protein VIN60_04135 [Anaerolineales bacterium]